MTSRVLVIAGPARSGKTAEMLARYRRALAELPPQSSLWLSPTWRAAANIRDRLLAPGVKGCLSPAVMTFDQFAEVVLRDSEEPVRPLNRLAKRQLIRLLLNEQLEAGRIRHFLPIAQTGGLVDQLCELTSELKRLDIWPDQFREACLSRGGDEKDAEVLAVYEAYQQVLNEHHLYDAEGRFWSARRLLREGCRGPVEHLRFVAVDGFTDFTPPQHEILQILAGWVDQLLITLPIETEPRREDLFTKPLRTLEELRRRHPKLVQKEMDRPAESEWPVMEHLEASLFANPRHMRPAPDTRGTEILAAARQLGEIQLVGATIKRLLTTGTEESAGQPVRPGDVAVVFRSLGDVDGLVREVFGKLGIPFALESGQTLDHSMALTALVGLVRLDVQDWPFRGLLAVLANNYFRPEWPEWQRGLAAVAAERVVRRLQIPRGRAGLLSQLKREAAHPAAEDDSVSSRVREERHQARLAFPLLARLARAFDALPHRASLGQWGDAWHALARDTGLLGVVGRDDRAGHTVPDRIAWETLQESLRTSDALARLVRRSPAELDRAGALAALVDVLRSVTVRGGLDESGRVRVLSAPSVRALRVPYLFFAGLAERSFPPPDRQDRLYSEAERRPLIEQGLPLAARSDRNREEMLLFYEVLTRASRHVWFSFPALDEAAQPLSASPYLQEVEEACGRGRIPRTEAADLSPVPAHPDPLTAEEFRLKAVSTALAGNVSLLAGLVGREPSPGLGPSVLAGLRIVDARQGRDEFGPAEGILSGDRARAEIATRFGPAWTFTATELEQYAACPYQFFAEQVLGLEPLDELDLAVDYLARGQLAHAGLADFHQRVNRLGQGPTSPASLSLDDYNRLLEETTERLAEPSGPGPLEAALHRVDLRLWAEWADDYREQHRAYDAQWRDCDVPLRPAWFEVSFGRSQAPRAGASPLSTDRPLELPAADGVIRIAGRIDRIDTGVVAGRNVFNVVDYKTGASTRYSREAIASGAVLQLPLYVLATERLLLADQDAVPWQAGYWYVQQKGFGAKQALSMHASREGRIEPQPDWEATLEQVLGQVARLVQGIRGAGFPVYNPDPQCTRLCPFRTVCRIHQVRSLEKTWEPSASEI